MTDQLSPEKIMQTGMAFWASKTLLSAWNSEFSPSSRTGPRRRELCNGTACIRAGARFFRHAGGARVS